MFHLIIFLLLSFAPIIGAQPVFDCDTREINAVIPGPFLAREHHFLTIYNRGDELLLWQAELEIITEPERIPLRDDRGDVLARFSWERAGENEAKPGIARIDDEHLLLVSSDPVFYAVFQHDRGYNQVRLVREWNTDLEISAVTVLDGIIYALPTGRNFLVRYNFEGQALGNLFLPVMATSLTSSATENSLYLLTNNNGRITRVDRNGNITGFAANPRQFLNNVGQITWVDSHDEFPLIISDGRQALFISTDFNRNQLFYDGEGFGLPNNGGDPNPADGFGHDGREAIFGATLADHYSVIDDGIREFWIVSLSEYEGTVAPGDSQLVEMNFDFAGLSDGEYGIDIHFINNDEENGDFVLSLNFDVTSGCSLYPLWPRTAGYPGFFNINGFFPDGIFPNQVALAEMKLWNVGTEALLVSSVEHQSEAFEVDIDTVWLESGEFQSLDVLFSAQEEGQYPDELIVFSNDPENEELVIDLIGTVYDPPEIQLSPSDSLVLATLPGDSAEVEISNRGGFRLHWRAEVVLFNPESEVVSFAVRPDSGEILAHSSRRFYVVAEAGERVNSSDSDDVSGKSTRNRLNLIREYGTVLVHSTDPNRPVVELPLVEVTGIDVEKDYESLPGNFTMALSPNPFNGRLNVSLENISPDGGRVEVVDLTGRCLAVVHFEGGELQVHTIDAASWSAGEYIVRAWSGGETKVEKVLLLK